VDPDKAADLDGRKLALTETVESLKAKGVNFDSSLPPDAPAILIAADEPDGVHWRVGYNNFYVITRYNHSALYAMAVYELAAAVKQRILLHDAARVAAGRRRSAATPCASRVRGRARARRRRSGSRRAARRTLEPPPNRPARPPRRRPRDAAHRARRRAARRTALALRQSAVLRGLRQALLRAVLERRLRGARRRVLVRPRLPQVRTSTGEPTTCTA
jgi:hypothetical protein